MLFINNGKNFCQGFNSNPIAELLLISCGKTRNLHPTKCIKPYKINQRINTMYNSTNYNEKCVENIKKDSLIIRG